MRAPGFWYRAPGILSLVLAPFGWLYGFGTARRVLRGEQYDPGVPVICVGNLNVGGTGKTPTVIALIQKLQERGHNPAVISRGYGGTMVGPHAVDERNDRAEIVGDEPLLLSAFASVWVAKDRVAGAKEAVANGADVLIMDDGFQSGALAIDLGIVVVDAARGFGNGRCLPAGPLREPIHAGLTRAEALLAIGTETSRERFFANVDIPSSVMKIEAELRPLPTGMDWSGLRVLAFAGIGHPEKFFITLKQLGAEVIETHGLSDHQPLDDRLLTRLAARAKTLGARLVCTEKDAVRLPDSMRGEVLTVPVRLELQTWEDLESVLVKEGL